MGKSTYFNGHVQVRKVLVITRGYPVIPYIPHYGEFHWFNSPSWDLGAVMAKENCGYTWRQNGAGGPSHASYKYWNTMKYHHLWFMYNPIEITL